MPEVPAASVEPGKVSAADQTIELCGVRLPEALTDDEIDALAAFVSAERRERIGRFRRREDRMRSLLAELLARMLLARRLHAAPGDIRFGRDRFGKPRCVSGPAHFNLSHSGEWVVAAVSGREIGVDVERIDPRMDLSLADRLFTPAERAYFESEEQGRRERFFELWTFKESYIKCTGTGLSVPLASFSVVPGPDGTATIAPCTDGGSAIPPGADGTATIAPGAGGTAAIAPRADGETTIATIGEFRLKQFPIDARHRLAVCSLGLPLDGVSFRELSFETLSSAYTG